MLSYSSLIWLRICFLLHSPCFAALLPWSVVFACRTIHILYSAHSIHSIVPYVFSAEQAKCTVPQSICFMLAIEVLATLLLLQARTAGSQSSAPEDCANR